VVLAVIFGSGFDWIFILITLFLIIYLIGDHLDGLQAKRTKTSSALGETFRLSIMGDLNDADINQFLQTLATYIVQTGIKIS